MSVRKGSSPTFVGRGKLMKLAKETQANFKLTWQNALLRAKTELGVSLMSVTFTSTPTALSVVFDSTVVLNGATVATYLWDFGDGGAGTGDPAVADPTNLYGADGTYNVRLTVTDTTGATTTAFARITVAA